MHVTVIGTGYLGATHAACLAQLGHQVLGLDTDAHKVAALNSGTPPFFEPGLPELLQRNLAAGRLQFTTDYALAARHANVHFLAVGTPQRPGSYAADVSFLHAAIRALAPHLRGHHVIVGKSTVPVGTAQALQELADTLAAPTATIELAWNPEFLREGHAVADSLRPDRIVLGVQACPAAVLSQHPAPEAAKPAKQQPGPSADRGSFAEPAPPSLAEAALRDIYAHALAQGTAFLVTDLQTAELVKVSANAFLATKISFINAVSEICEATGADVVALSQALGLDQRIGPHFLGAGLGFGGGCLPKDIRAFMARAGELGVDQALTFLREVDAINQRRRQRVVDLAREACGGAVRGHRIAMLGCAFKPNSDDVRDSPALAVAGALALAGAQVAVYDPQGMANAAQEYPTLEYADSTAGALRGAHLVILATEWQEFCELDPHAAAGWVACLQLIDARNALPVPAWLAAGWTVRALGRTLD
ncbi:UDP-glucose dehydrogenase family protein [Corynebacterium lizhenjunii]|uniref:UDP-glucose dehydrogenase family protein n=1 Tax=Corynebacterium lizhenjunii TaxID=2709394 RepID=UPI001980E5E4|nr:UDP-glucose/GDP-mannose dehydrogenase family protein [Corynebacterium lizhenjunii]